MLSDRELIAINDKNPSQPLFPFLRQSEGSPSYGLSGHGYDIRLSNEFWISESISEVIDLRHPQFNRLVKDSFKRVVSDSIKLYPGDFILAASFEAFDIPNDVSMELKDKSTWARLGIQVFNTISESGWRAPHLVIEIYNNSRNSVRLYSGMGIAQAVFHKLSSPSLVSYADRKGKYMNQGDGENKVTLAR